MNQSVNQSSLVVTSIDPIFTQVPKGARSCPSELGHWMAASIHLPDEGGDDNHDLRQPRAWKPRLAQPPQSRVTVYKPGEVIF